MLPPILKTLFELANARYLPTAGQTLSLHIICVILEHNIQTIPINKSRLIRLIPDGMGSQSRVRYVLAALVSTKAIEERKGHKRSEINLIVSKNVKEICFKLALQENARK